MDVLDKIMRVEAHMELILDQACITMPKTAIVLGSGLSDVADALQHGFVLPFADIDDFPVSTAPGSFRNSRATSLPMMFACASLDQSRKSTTSSSLA
jgi:purine nucleoside phosphorylase